MGVFLGIDGWWWGGGRQPRDKRYCVIISLALTTAEVEPWCN